MPRMTRASERASKPMAPTDPQSLSRESTSSWQIPTVSAPKLSWSQHWQRALQEEELDLERSEDPEADEGESDPDAGSGEDPFVAGDGKTASLN